jgi:hypothetical protein
MQPYRERVIAECDELQDRLNKLSAFIDIDDGVFDGLEEAERNRLYKQEAAMSAYLSILKERIENF